jgi:starch-binding outer membrane protein, SusD/RagB family
MKNRNLFMLILTASLLFTQSSCIKEYTDPSSISDKQVVSNVDGLLGLCNSLQFRYSVGRQSPVYQNFNTSGLLTKEIVILTVGNTDEVNMAAGAGAVQGGNNMIVQLWAQSYIILNDANTILNNLGVAGDPATKATVQAYAQVYKGLAFGTLAQFFEKMPVVLGKNAPFVSREEALRLAVSGLEEAEKAMSGVTIPANVASKLVVGFDLKNTIFALQARLNLMLKDYTKAAAAAGKVDLAVKSGFRYDAVNTNSIFVTSYSNRLVVEPSNRQMGLPAALAPDTADKRLPFYLNPAASSSINLGLGFARNVTSEIPVYLPGEIRLIKAECFAQTDVGAAITELNGVIKKKASGDAWGVGADIAAGYTGAATKEAVLTEIYRQRCIELFNSGLRLEDSRRFGRPDSERGRDFLPYSQVERDGNTSTPTDPVK